MKREARSAKQETRADYSASTPPRYEVKIPLPARFLADVEAWVRLHPAQWRTAYPPRQVNNVYFDTVTYAGLAANLDGTGDRAKLRLRWYGTAVDAIAGAHLELKCKRGMVGWKEMVPVDAAISLRGTTWRAFARDLRAATTGRARAWLDVYCVPVIVSHYRRAYYVTPDGGLRLTIDTALRAYDQRVSVSPNVTVASPQEARVIVELKAPTDAVRYLSAVLAYFPAPVDRFSKYVQGALAAPEFV